MSSPGSDVPGVKPYVAPALTVFGSVTSFTASLTSSNGMNDMGGGSLKITF